MLHSSKLNFQQTEIRGKFARSLGDVTTWQKQVSKIDISINCTRILTTKNNARPSSMEHYILTFFDCEKLFVPGFTFHSRLLRSPNNTILFLKGIDDEAKALDGKVQAIIEKASLFVRKVVVTDSLKLSIEKALLKRSALDPYIENLNKNFIIQAGQNCFVNENVFGTEPIKRLTLCMVKISLFQSTASKYSLFYHKFNLQRVQIQRRNGVPLAGTPMDTGNNIRLYCNTITSLGFIKNGNGIKLDDFDDNLFFLAFDLTSTEEASLNLVSRTHWLELNLETVCLQCS